jgi:cytochrome c oxidase subunit 2
LHWHKPQSKILIVGAPTPARRAFSPVTELARFAVDGWLLVMCAAISLFVVGPDCLGGPALQCKIEPDTSDIHPFHRKFAWTIVPIVILIFIGAFSAGSV